MYVSQVYRINLLHGLEPYLHVSGVLQSPYLSLPQFPLVEMEMIDQWSRTSVLLGMAFVLWALTQFQPSAARPLMCALFPNSAKRCVFPPALVACALSWVISVIPVCSLTLRAEPLLVC